MNRPNLTEAELSTLRLIVNTPGGVAFGASGRDRGAQAKRAAKLVRLGLASVGTFKTEVTDDGRALIEEIDGR
jgi:hypothetical protein